MFQMLLQLHQLNLNQEKIQNILPQHSKLNKVHFLTPKEPHRQVHFYHCWSQQRPMTTKPTSQSPDWFLQSHGPHNKKSNKKNFTTSPPLLKRGTQIRCPFFPFEQQLESCLGATASDDPVEMLTGPTGEVLRRAHPMGGGTPIALRGLVWWTFWHVTLFCAWIRVNTPLWRAHLGGPFRCWGKEFHEAHSLNETSYTHGCLIVWGGMDVLTSFSSMGISREIMTDFFFFVWFEWIQSRVEMFVLNGGYIWVWFGLVFFLFEVLYLQIRKLKGRGEN